MPTYGEWIYYIARKWEPPKGIDQYKMLGFCAAIASYGDDGKDLYPSNETLAKDQHCSVRKVRKLRQQARECGLLKPNPDDSRWPVAGLG